VSSFDSPRIWKFFSIESVPQSFMQWSVPWMGIYFCIFCRCSFELNWSQNLTGYRIICEVTESSFPGCFGDNEQNNCLFHLNLKWSWNKWWMNYQYAICNFPSHHLENSSWIPTKFREKWYLQATRPSPQKVAGQGIHLRSASTTKVTKIPKVRKIFKINKMQNYMIIFNRMLKIYLHRFYSVWTKYCLKLWLTST
jgi:hypothetical protein